MSLTFASSHWNRKTVLREIRALHRGKADLSYVGACRENLPLVSAANYYFGGWGRAVRTAGIRYERHRRCRAWNPEGILREIRKHTRKGTDLSYNAFARRNLPLLAAAAYHFGSWERTLRRAGLDYRAIRKQKRWTVEDIFAEIRRLKREGVDLSWKAMQRSGRSAVVSVACFYLKTWGRAIDGAGLDYSEIRKKPGLRPRRNGTGGATLRTRA